MAVQKVSLNKSAGQSFSTAVEGKKVDFLFRYNYTSQRFWVDVKIDDEYVIRGRTLIAETDILAPFSLGIGKLLALDIQRKGRSPTIEEIAADNVEVLFVS